MNNLLKVPGGVTVAQLRLDPAWDPLRGDPTLSGTTQIAGHWTKRRPMNEFLQRLKQRKLVQWGVAYIAAAFALLQGVDIVAQQFGWPEGVRRGITLALVVGFFVALAWPGTMGNAVPSA